MAARRTRRTGMIQGWIALIALALFASLSAHAQGRLQLPRDPSNQLGMALPIPGPNANMGKIKSRQGRSLAHGTGQAQVSEGETGENGTCGSDLMPGQPARLADPGNVERAWGYPDSGTFVRSAWRAGTNRPRPPPVP